ncbi:ankyrin [Microthyrium microscopicum]|uniref:Ankyrin n=1 Tax=Microthyrium microscopicum TaxID=703497 RepID=A0A6A6TY23_9PEZI|nr:ankyrin [Microthyrium microscopicum]
MDSSEETEQPRPLPPDLPTSLDDRRSVPVFGAETEIYDAWQGQSQFLTSPVPSQPLRFSLSLADEQPYEEQDITSIADDSDSRLVRMLASQARLRAGGGEAGEDALLSDPDLSDPQKRETLQNLLAMAASNGEVERVGRLLTGPAKEFVNINAPDADGNVPIIYASCFGHLETVKILMDNGAEVDKKDTGSWNSLMWAITNRHKEIAKYLLDHGASQDSKTSSGRTAFDFVSPNSEMSEFLSESGYQIGNAGVSDDFYDAGFAHGRFEEEMAENEMRQRMMMESAMNLEVDLGNLTLDEQSEPPAEELEEGQEFLWDKCLHDQMFVFQEADLDRILDVVITNMTPSRSPSQKPVPANILFLAARYAHYHAHKELLEVLLSKAFARINDTVERHQWDMTMLAFWISNSTLLLHYLRKDAGLVDATPKYQLALSEVINEIFILVIRDAERRMDKVLDKAMMEYESIPGFEDVTFQNEWKIFKRAKTKAIEPLEKRFRPPSPKRKAQISPRNITSLLSSTLFVLELYDIHSVIIAQVLAQLFYWLGSEIFNRILNSRKYLARTKAMQIRMNVSTLEDWARANNRQAEHYEHGSTESTGEKTIDSARKHLEPIHQLLQWLQISSSIGDDFEALITAVKQFPRLTPIQLHHAAKYYRNEVGEKMLPKNALKYLESLQASMDEHRIQQKAARRALTPALGGGEIPSIPTTPVKERTQNDTLTSSPAPGLSPARPGTARSGESDSDDAPDNLFMDAAFTLPFELPSSTDMLVSYGAGFGGQNKARERKYTPQVSPEFLATLDFSSGNGTRSNVYGDGNWDAQE